MRTDDSSDDSLKDLQAILPFIKSWKQIYLLVIGELVLLIILFFFFSNSFQ